MSHYEPEFTPEEIARMCMRGATFEKIAWFIEAILGMEVNPDETRDDLIAAINSNMEDGTIKPVDVSDWFYDV